MEVDFELSGIVRARLRSCSHEVLTGDNRRSIHDVIDLLTRGRRVIGPPWHNLSPLRKHSAMSSQSGALGRISLVVGNQRQFELPARLNHGLRARRITLTRKLYQDFVVAAASKCDRRLSQTEAVDAARNGFKRLVHRLRAKVGDYRGLQCE